VWLESTFLALHFGLAAILVSRARIAERISQILGVVIMVPLGIIIFILGILLVQSIRASYHFGVEQEISDWIIASLVLFLLVGPEVLIFRYIVFAFDKWSSE
jgi:hypothetical protein